MVKVDELIKLEALKKLSSWKFSESRVFHDKIWKRKIGKNYITIDFDEPIITASINNKKVIDRRMDKPFVDLENLLRNPNKIIKLAKLRGVI